MHYDTWLLHWHIDVAAHLESDQTQRVQKQFERVQTVWAVLGTHLGVHFGAQELIRNALGIHFEAPQASQGSIFSIWQLFYGKYKNLRKT